MQVFLSEMSEILECIATPETVMRDQPGWDSMAVLSIIATIEERYGVIVTGTAIYECSTLKDLYEEVQNAITART